MKNRVDMIYLVCPNPDCFNILGTTVDYWGVGGLFKCKKCDSDLTRELVIECVDVYAIDLEIERLSKLKHNFSHKKFGGGLVHIPWNGGYPIRCGCGNLLSVEEYEQHKDKCDSKSRSYLFPRESKKLLS